MSKLASLRPEMDEAVNHAAELSEDVRLKLAAISREKEEMIRIEREDFVREQGLEQGLQQGLEQGVNKGRQEGRQEGQRAIVINLLDHMTPEQVAKATKLPLSEVLAASKKKRQGLALKLLK